MRPADGRVVRVGLLSVGALLLVALVAAPDRLGLHGALPTAQVVALRGPGALGLLALAGVLVLLPWRRTLAVPAAVLVLGAVVSGTVLLGRGTAGLAGQDAAPASDLPADALVVLVLNTQAGVEPADLADLVVARGADVVVLPETWSSTATEVAALVADRGLDLQVLADDDLGISSTDATSLLVARHLGEYEVVASLDTAMAGFTAAPVDGDGPPITAAHPFPPLPGAMGTWADEGAEVAAVCRPGTGAVVAGDLNATLDHPALRHLPCVDAGVAGGAGGVGTWPASVPRVLGAPIDHVLVDGSAWRVLRAAVLEPPPGTDHRAVEAVLVPQP